MQLLELNKVIENIYRGVPTINSVYNGDVYSLWVNNPKLEYTSFVFDVKNVTIEDDIMTYTYQFTIGDRLMNDNDNYNVIYESNYKAIEQGINQLLKDERIIEISGGRNYNFVRQKFADILGATFVEVRISTVKDFGNC